MKNSLQLALNAILLIAVGVLFYLHFAQKPAAPAPVAAATAPAKETKVVALDTAKAAPALPEDNLRKVAYVESSKLLDQYKGLQDARKAFERKIAGWERQHEQNVRGLQAAAQAYEKTAAGLTDEQRAATVQRLQAQEQQVAAKQQQLQQQAQQEEAKMTEQVLTRVNKLLEAYGKENDYDLILVAGGGTIAYARPGLDITKEILGRLNAEYANRSKK
ncbi:OmpH family outer membrane protein [Hymenobacter oligotrophus]|uniref:OmpH family outer membrane protein n=1 Tax=Hymenobacter oligotrophus TaxID=2319843 RepID=A0A3B7R1J9_9BACT|nr:OmpH family outer membrane protein [Hymenobacter oligotrophus]AYA37293.1 OmpH family outer membrane protein [Hymenobacter oligotrophus]